MKKLRRHFSLIGKLLVAAVSLVLVREQFDREVFLKIIQTPSLFFILISLVLVNQFLVSWRLEKLFSLVKCRIPYWSLVRATFVSMLFASVLPGVVGADLAKIVLIRRVNPDKGLSLIGSGILLDRAIGMGTLILISLAASLFLPLSELTKGQSQLVYFFWLVGAGLFGLWAACMIFQHWFSRLEFGSHTPGYKFKVVRRVIEMIRLWRLRIVDQAAVILISSLALFVFVLPQAIIADYLLRQSGLPSNFPLMMFLFPGLTVISALPITPLGLGVGQLAIQHAFQLFGLPAGVGVAVATFNQLAQVLISVTCGGPLFWLNHGKAELPVDEAEAVQKAL